MPARAEHRADEIRRLQRCISDLISVLALPAIWSGRDPSQIARTLLDTLLGMLHLDLVYVRLKNLDSEAPIEMARVTPSKEFLAPPAEIGKVLDGCLGPDPKSWAPMSRSLIGDVEISIVPSPLGMHGDIGIVVAGSRRPDFPEPTEQLLLAVAANQAAIGLQEARLLAEQRRVADELDRRVAQRTEELAAANLELRKGMAERMWADERLRQEEQELKRSEARKAAILNSALDCIVTIDHEGCITEFNPAAERTFGHRRDEVIGKRLAEVVIPPSLREAHLQGMARYLRGGEARVLGRRVEMTAIRADGSEFPAELTVTRIPLDGPPSFTGYLRDITERKHAEEQLRQSEAFLAEAQRVSSTGAFSWCVATDEIRWSAEVYRIFEIEQGVSVTLDLIGSRLHPEDFASFQEMLVRQRQDGCDFEHDHRLLMADHSVKYVHEVCHASRDRDDRLVYVGAVQDVTERRLAEEALGKARSELAHVSRVTSLGVMTASIAHEVSQPLSGIVTNASTCLRMLAAEPPDIAGAVETARRTIRDGNRASDVITRLRALFAKKDAATDPVDLNDAAQEVIALSQGNLQRNRVIVRTDLADDLPPVTGDRVQLQQVILNLLLNASEAMSSVEDRPRRLEIATGRDEDDRIRLAVKDAGVGFDPHRRDKLFEPFFTTKSGGMGIGLSVSRSIVESHHGRLWAAPNQGPGATFSFSIPRRTEDATTRNT